jgi:hypothetical protein
MDTKTTPLGKWETRKRNDLRATSRYAARPAIDRLLEERRLERELMEVWG